MIPVPSGVRVWLAVGRTDMRKGMNGLALQVQQELGRDPHAGDLYVFRGARGDLLKIVWHDGIGMSLYAKRLERGRFIWPSPADGVVAISAAQLAYMLDGIDWRNPVFTGRPEVARCSGLRLKSAPVRRISPSFSSRSGRTNAALLSARSKRLWRRGAARSQEAALNGLRPAGTRSWRSIGSSSSRWKNREWRRATGAPLS
jgi:transposase